MTHPMDPSRVMRLRISHGWFAPCGEALVARCFQILGEQTPGTRSLFPADTASLHPRILRTLRQVLSNAHEFRTLEPPLARLGEKLQRRAGGVEHLLPHAAAFRDAFICVLAEAGGRSFTHQMEQDWRMLLDGVLGAMIAGAEPARRAA